MIPTRIIAYALLALSIFAAGALASAKFYRGLLDALRTEYAEFKGGVEALGKAAIKRRQIQESADLKRKLDADKEHAVTVAALNRTIGGLRDDLRSGRGGLSAPAPAPIAGSAQDRICFDRAEFGAALQRLDGDLLGIVEEGAEAIDAIKAARAWALH